MKKVCSFISTSKLHKKAFLFSFPYFHFPKPASIGIAREHNIHNGSDSYFQGSLLVNIARGGLLDYEAIAHYLESGHLGGLGIDVAWTEPFDPNDPILKFKNVLITPHVGGVTEHSYRSMAKVCIGAISDRT